MKSKAIAFFCIFLLVGCGPSQKEIAEQEKLESEARYAELQLLPSI
tara:strand:- start:368 stop:505 length:138 start_codon:yes stop_codon:yes gene_type:complete